MARFSMLGMQHNPGHDEYKRTTEPVVVGASVLGITYKDGVLLMADTGASYFSVARFTNLDRIRKVNDKVVVAFGGELSDFQYLERLLEDIAVEDAMADDGHVRGPEEVHSFICRVMHNYRNKADPLYNQIVTSGIGRDGKPFIGYCDLYGTNHVDDVVVTGFGVHMSLPLLRASWRPDLEYTEARKILEDAMCVLVYRHCRTINKFSLANITKGGMTISEPYALNTKWDYKRFVNPRSQQ